MTTVLGLSSIVLYLAGAAVLFVRLLSLGPAGALMRQHLAAATALGLALHGIVLYQVILTESGLNLGFFNAASLVAWVVVLFLFLAAVARPLENLGIFVLPLAAICVGLALAYPSERVLSESSGLGLKLHVITSIFAYSVLTIAAFQAILLAYQERRLRLKRPGRVLGILPPMQSQESLLFQMIGLGFFLLSISLATGMVFLDNMFEQQLVHKTVLSLSAWLVFALLLWGRWRYGWRGRTVIRWSLGGFVTLMLAYFGSKLVLELILQRDLF